METHDRPGYPWWLAVLLMLAVAAAVGVFTYNLGIAQGIADSSRLVVAPGAAPGVAAPGAPGTVAPFVYYYPRHWGWGWGFGFFPFFGLLWIFLIFGVMRRLLWGGRWYGRRCGYGYYGYGGVPPAFDEWHRRAHGQQTPPATTQL